MRLKRRRRRARVTITIIIMVLRGGMILFCSSKILEDFKGADCGEDSQDGASWGFIPRAKSPGEGDGVEDGNVESKLAPAEMLGSGDKEEENIFTLVASRCGDGDEYLSGEKDKVLEVWSKGG